MRKVMIVLVCLLVLCSGCSYLSSNIIKLRGDEIKGHFASSPINLTGKNIVVTIYREMILTLKNLKPRFVEKVIIEDDKEKGDIDIKR